MDGTNWDEIVEAVQSGKVDGRAIWDRLTDDERVPYMEAMHRYAQGRELNRSDNAIVAGKGWLPDIPPELAVAGAGKAVLGGVGSIMGKLFGPRNLEREVGIGDIAEQVQRGVQNDFRGRVTFEKPGGANPMPNGAPKVGETSFERVSPNAPGGAFSALDKSGPTLRSLSEGEEIGIRDLEELLDRTGSTRPNPMGHGTYKEGGSGHLGGPDVAGLRKQPNVSVKRTPADVEEQVKRGVSLKKRRPGYADSRDVDLGYGAADPEVQAQVDALRKVLAGMLDRSRK